MNNARGSVLWIILIAVALLAALSFAVTSSGRVGGTFGSDDKATLAASGVLDYVRNAQAVVQQMVFDGNTSAQLDFTKPGEASFETAPFDKKVFHPGGGALPVLKIWDELLAKNASPTAGIYFINNAIDDIGTFEPELMMIFLEIHPEICKKLNLKLTGSDVIPTIEAGNSTFGLFIDPLSITPLTCSSCVGVDMLCVKDDYGAHTFYAVLQKN